MQRRVDGRGDSDRRKLVLSTGSSFVRRGRDYSSAVHLVFTLMLILISPGVSGAETRRAYLDISGGYKTGDFGTPTKSELFYVSPTLGYVTPQ